jgi:hypothetical protein
VLKGMSLRFLITEPARSLSTKNVSSGTTVSGHSTVRASSTVWHVARIIGASPTLQPRQRRQVASRKPFMHHENTPAGESACALQYAAGRHAREL